MCHMITYPSALFQILHGWIMDGLARCQFGGIDQFTESGGNIFNCIDHHDLGFWLPRTKATGTAFHGISQLYYWRKKSIYFL